MLNQAQSNDTKERDHESGDECKRHLSPDAARQLPILEIGSGVKGDECHRAGGKHFGQVAVGSFDTFMGYFVANDTYEVDDSMPHPHMAALAMSAERCPWTRSTG